MMIRHTEGSDLLTVELEEEALDELNLGMMKYNQIPGFAPITETEKGKKFSYHLKQGVSLMDLRKDPMEEDQVLRLIGGLYLAYRQSFEYLLNRRGILLDERYVFPVSDEVGAELILIPAETEYTESLDDFVRNLLSSSRFRKPEKAVWIGEVLNVINDPKPARIPDREKEIRRICMDYRK